MGQQRLLIRFVAVNADVALRDRGVLIPRKVKARVWIGRIEIDRKTVLAAVREKAVAIFNERFHRREGEKSAHIDPLREINFQIRLGTSLAAALAGPGIKRRITQMLMSG